MSNMKFTLDIEEQKYEKGRDDQRFKFFKKMLMANTYENMRKCFKDLEDIGILVPGEEDVKDGYRDTPSGGSGYQNSDRFNAWLELDN